MPPGPSILFYSVAFTERRMSFFVRGGITNVVVVANGMRSVLVYSHLNCNVIIITLSWVGGERGRGREFNFTISYYCTGLEMLLQVYQVHPCLAPPPLP